MSHSPRLSFGEFLKDIRLVITSPAHRFTVIQERGASWGSMGLLLIPAYLGFAFFGGLVFSRDPFSGYSFVVPLAIAVAVVFLKLYLIHVPARMLEGRKPASGKPGTFAGLKTVFGYTKVPEILALVLATAIFLSMPQEIGQLRRDLKIVSISIMIAMAIALFIWNLILVVLALRTVYAMRDIKLVLAFILGSVLMSVPGVLSSYWIVAQPHIDFMFVQPVYSNRILRFFATDPTSSFSTTTKISVYVDRIAYTLRTPERFELVIFRLARKSSADGGTSVDIGEHPLLRWEDDYGLGRIVGIPGDTVELAGGVLRVNGQTWDEPYVIPEFQSTASLSPKSLGPQEYFILPDNRNLIGKLQNEFVIGRYRILGREILSRWPLGWWIYRPTVFIQPSPAQSQ